MPAYIHHTCHNFFVPPISVPPTIYQWRAVKRDGSVCVFSPIARDAGRRRGLATFRRLHASLARSPPNPFRSSFLSTPPPLRATNTFRTQTPAGRTADVSGGLSRAAKATGGKRGQLFWYESCTKK